MRRPPSRAGRSSPARLDALARALEEAGAAAGVAVARDPIPHGLKITLRQGLAAGVVSIYATGRVVPNPAARQHFADLLDRLEPRAAPGRVAAGRGHDPVTFPYLGSDESGKGDYFGPLAVAAVLLRDRREEELVGELGARDSKLLASPAEARRLAAGLRSAVAGRFAEVVIEPSRYNQLQAELAGEGKTSNALLAWAHARAWRPLLGEEPGLVVADKFGSEYYLRRELGRLGASLELRQETRGERYLAVAAASILARDLCLEWFERAQAEVGERLPRGAFDPAIVEVARRLWRQGGDDRLGRYAKLHFRTSHQVRGDAPVPVDRRLFPGGDRDG